MGDKFMFITDAPKPPRYKGAGTDFNVCRHSDPSEGSWGPKVEDDDMTVDLDGY